MKTWTIGLALLVSTSGLALAAGPLTPVAQLEPVTTILDTPQGIVIGTDSAVDHDLRCSGEDIPDYYCSTGAHTRTLGLSHGFVAPFPNEGTLESRVIVTGGNARVFRCSFSGGALTGCAGSGSFPAVGDTYEHDCWRYILNSPSLPLTPAALVPLGVPGGNGAWTCQTSAHGA